MNLPEIFLKAKWKTEAGYHKEAHEDCQLAIDYLTKLTIERGDDYMVVGYTPILGEKIMTKFGVQKRIVKYDKELRPGILERQILGFIFIGTQTNEIARKEKRKKITKNKN